MNTDSERHSGHGCMRCVGHRLLDVCKSCRSLSFVCCWSFECRHRFLKVDKLTVQFRFLKGNFHTKLYLPYILRIYLIEAVNFAYLWNIKTTTNILLILFDFKINRLNRYWREYCKYVGWHLFCILTHQSTRTEENPNSWLRLL